MKALVTGGAGFIGSHLVDRLIADGAEVVVLDDLSSGGIENLHPKSDFVEGSVTNQALIESIGQFDAIFHLAAIASVQRSIEDPNATHAVNVGGTENAAKLAIKTGAKLIYSSSSAVYGDAVEMPIPEEAAKNPISPYGRQKLESEGVVARADGVSLRYFNVYGPRQRPDSDYSGVISIFKARAARGEPLVIYGDGQATRDFIHVQDVVEANLLALKAEPAAFNICCGVGTSILTLAKAVMETSSIQFLLARPGDILASIGDCRLAASQLNFRAQIDFQSGIRF